MEPILILFVIIGVPCAFGWLSSTIAKGRGRSGLWFWAGFFFLVVGLLITYLMTSEPPVPEGSRRVRCARCNAKQNVPEAADSYECWQCHASLSVLPR